MKMWFIWLIRLRDQLDVAPESRLPSYNKFSFRLFLKYKNIKCADCNWLPRAFRFIFNRNDAKIKQNRSHMMAHVDWDSSGMDREMLTIITNYARTRYALLSNPKQHLRPRSLRQETFEIALTTFCWTRRRRFTCCSICHSLIVCGFNHIV